MTFGFYEPNIHNVADIRADAEILTFGPDTLNPGKRFAVMRLTFLDAKGAEVQMSAYFPAAFAGRALDIAEAINASKTAPAVAAE
jgi:hypothetical protein